MLNIGTIILNDFVVFFHFGVPNARKPIIQQQQKQRRFP
jgi:hypothetical protein